MMAFGEEFFKGSVRERLQARNQLMNSSQLGWHGSGFKYHQPFGFNWSWISVLWAAAFPPGEGFSISVKLLKGYGSED